MTSATDRKKLLQMPLIPSFAYCTKLIDQKRDKAPVKNRILDILKILMTKNFEFGNEEPVHEKQLIEEYKHKYMDFATISVQVESSEENCSKVFGIAHPLLKYEVKQQQSSLSQQ